MIFDLLTCFCYFSFTTSIDDEEKDSSIKYLLQMTSEEARQLELFLVRGLLVNGRLPKDEMVMEYVCADEIH
jgi:hypothetical protein